MESLEGKVAWVLGAGSGIGEAAARALAGNGCAVVLSGRRSEPLEEVRSAIAAGGGTAETEPLDVSEAEAVKSVADGIVSRHGRLDILVNSAGLKVLNRHWPDLDTEAWDTVLQINLDGAFYATHAVLPQMREQKDGLIINVASWAGRFDTYLTGPAYNASKHGLIAMSAHLNIEEGKHGIRACAISPGEVNTPILDKRPVPVPDEEKVRMMQAEDMGETVLFVARMHPRVCVNEILISPTWNRLSMP